MRSLARAAALMALCAAADGAAAGPLDCLPAKAGAVTIPGATGTQLRYASADTGFWLGWWCPAPAPAGAPAGQTYWKPNVWAALTQYKAANPDPVGAIQTALSASDPLAGVNALAAASAVTPAAGTLDEYNLKTLYWSACRALAAQPDFPNPLPIAATYCGSAPVAPPPPAPPPPPPPPPPAVWEVTPNGTAATRPSYQATQDATTGKWTRSITTGGQATVLSVCDCAAIDIFEYNITHYCKVPVDPAPQVTACRQRK